MRRILRAVVVLGVTMAVSTPAFADGHDAGEAKPKAEKIKVMKHKAEHMPLRAAYVAEHAAWSADHERWEADHEKAIVILRGIIAQLKSENQLSDHDANIEKHGEILSADDMMALAKEHAAQRVAHEEMRDAHHHLMDAVHALSLAAQEDLAAERD